MEATRFFQRLVPVCFACLCCHVVLVLSGCVHDKAPNVDDIHSYDNKTNIPENLAIVATRKPEIAFPDLLDVNVKIKGTYTLPDIITNSHTILSQTGKETFTTKVLDENEYVFLLPSCITGKEFISDFDLTSKSEVDELDFLSVCIPLFCNRVSYTRMGNICLFLPVHDEFYKSILTTFTGRIPASMDVEKLDVKIISSPYDFRKSTFARVSNETYIACLEFGYYPKNVILDGKLLVYDSWTEREDKISLSVLYEGQEVATAVIDNPRHNFTTHVNL